ncbi:nitroreductase family deazaflavin-dependent oxidoreductase [Actinomadura craniellae]|uniref:Nitroreductase family deazaflavin-dependent oxidoreductase n=1 Tax=Actinomadura craniellae TaxID=2231787 RepID=A0A365H0R9_9ACTN|nr:nitroreductase family deazaflavin-dependent oxidoreductase [Actinomadura craniellae]RAY12680.1 nitroreductase family deazaflavin-dependent oxidoreductase [Actinomadura craniellae]
MTEGSYLRPDLSLAGAEHVRRYQETDGEVGYRWNGAHILLLTTTGRNSGRPRTAPLIFARAGDDYLVVASKGGAPTHPAWYLNLRENPQARIQVRAERLSVVARTAGEQEKPRLWKIVNEVWPPYDDYQARTDRDIPVVVLTPVPRDEAG